MTRALKQGKIIMLSAEPLNLPKGKLEQIKSLDALLELLDRPEYIDFPLGYFLLVVEPGAYFSFHTGVDGRPRRRAVFDNSRFEAITRKLGWPLGDYVRVAPGVFEREFEFLRVHVNINNGQRRSSLLTPKDGGGGDEL